MYADLAHQTLETSSIPLQLTAMYGKCFLGPSTTGSTTITTNSQIMTANLESYVLILPSTNECVFHRRDGNLLPYTVHGGTTPIY